MVVADLPAGLRIAAFGSVSSVTLRNTLNGSGIISVIVGSDDCKFVCRRLTQLSNLQRDN